MESQEYKVFVKDGNYLGCIRASSKDHAIRLMVASIEKSMGKGAVSPESLSAEPAKELKGQRN